MDSLEARQARVEEQLAALKNEVAQKAGGGTVADSEVRAGVAIVHQRRACVLTPPRRATGG